MTQIDEAAIFNDARKIDDIQEREAYLRRACAHDEAVYQQVSTLLQAYDKDPEFLEPPPIEIGRPMEISPVSEGPGTVIGRYKLLEQIGEGGFAVVYMAEQLEPVRRTVALKLIKPGMDTKQVIARFEAERQALAMMDHQGIAEVHDAGATPSGRPYFVMQLIRGVPITEYCDQCSLSTKERLDLFIGVCRAVQHAHQKGVIHRDIKPTNVLVALHDGKPVPKVIDFGIAKAIRQRLTEKTLYTHFRQIIGTPQYMSPEQAEFSDLDIDTRSDIYSLGVLLYELMTSTTPFKSGELCRMGYEEICQSIRQGDLSTPSKALSTLGDSIAEAASKRQTDPTGLSKLLRGDLDWVVMKALEKDRTRRYETADALAADIQRHLDDEPVQARPPSTLYRLKKFGRKYRLQVTAVVTLFALLTVGFALALVALVRIDQERQTANAQRDQAQHNLLLARQLVRDVLVPASGRLELVLDTQDVQTTKAVMLEQAIRFYGQILQQTGDDPNVRLEMAQVCRQRAHQAFMAGESGESFARRSILLLTPLVDDHPNDARYLDDLADSHAELARLQWADLRYKDASKNHRVAVNTLEDLIERFPSESQRRYRALGNHGSLAYVLQHAGEHEAAEQHYRRALEIQRGSDGAWIRRQYATLLMKMNRYGEAELALEQAWNMLVEQRDAESSTDRAHADFWKAQVLTGYGELFCHAARLEQAEEYLKRSIELGEKLLEDFDIPFAYNNLGWSYYHLSEVLVRKGRPREAEQTLRRALHFWSSSAGRMVRHNAALASLRLGELRHQQGDADEAHARFQRAKEDLEKISRALPDEPYSQQRLIVLLAHCPDHEFRDARRAVTLAQRVKTDSDGPLWRCLALSHYRVGAWAEAKSSIERSIELRSGGDPMDWILLAMAQWQLGQRTEAERTFARVEAAISSGIPILYLDIGILGFERLRAEANGLLAAATSNIGASDRQQF